ncbi:MAG: hypothetical protein Q8P59_05975, partial [Dehalococcoidia bacterium]|nr:hypothetical protein [Dehalococcoidia bacterium]
GRVISSKGNSTGYEECLHKSYLDLHQVLGDDFGSVKPVQGKSYLRKFFRKDVFLRAPNALLRENASWDVLKSHIRRTLQDDYFKYLQHREANKYYPRPSCTHIPAQILLDVEFLTGDKKWEEWGTLINLPWVVLEIGESDKRNKYLPEVLLALEAGRRVAGKSTWVFTKRDLSWLQDRYGDEVMEWLKGLPEETVR